MESSAQYNKLAIVDRGPERNTGSNCIHSPALIVAVPIGW